VPADYHGEIYTPMSLNSIWAMLGKNLETDLQQRDGLGHGLFGIFPITNYQECIEWNIP
jgi:hypothetical protein